MKDQTQNATNKKQGNGNGNSVINNYEHSRNCGTDYVSGDSSTSSSSHKFENCGHNSK